MSNKSIVLECARPDLKTTHIRVIQQKGGVLIHYGYLRDVNHSGRVRQQFYGIGQYDELSLSACANGVWTQANINKVLRWVREQPQIKLRNQYTSLLQTTEDILATRSLSLEEKRRIESIRNQVMELNLMRQL